MLQLIIGAVCAVLGTILLVLGISGILAGINYKNEIPIDRTELLIDALMISFGIFLITL